MRSRINVAIAALATIQLVATTARAELSPEWIAELPAGSALTAGLQGMVTDAQGVSYITGITGPSSNTDLVTAAFGPDGTLLWQDVFNGSADWHDQARGLGLGPGGVVYVTGNTPGPGSYANVLLLKYDAATGARLDVVQYSTAPFTSEHGASVAVDPLGNVFVGGGTVGDGADGLMLGFDGGGALGWMRTYDGPASAPYSQDHVRQVQVDPNGDVIAMVYGVMSTLHPDYVVIKYDPVTGELLWQTNWGVYGGDAARDMAIDAEGDIYVTGTGIDFIDKYSTIKLRGSDGQLLWQKYDSFNFRNYASAVALDGSGGVYITGSTDPDGDLSNFNDNFYTVKRDATTGDQLWTHLYGDNCVGCLDVPGDVIVDSAGHALVVGATSSAPYSSDLIMFVLDAVTGLETDRGVIGGDPAESAGGSILRLDADENIYIGGGFSNANTGAVDMAVFKYAALAGVSSCPGDTNADLQVNIADFLAVLGAWGTDGQGEGLDADLDDDGIVGIADFLMVLGDWGPCP